MLAFSVAYGITKFGGCLKGGRSDPSWLESFVLSGEEPINYVYG